MPSFPATFLLAALAAIPYVAAAEKPCVKFGGFMNGAIVYGNDKPLALSYEVESFAFNVTSSSTGETLCDTNGAEPSKSGDESNWSCSDGAVLMWRMVKSSQDDHVRATLRYTPKDIPEIAVLGLEEGWTLTCQNSGGCRGDITGVKCFQCQVTVPEDPSCEGI